MAMAMRKQGQVESCRAWPHEHTLSGRYYSRTISILPDRTSPSARAWTVGFIFVRSLSIFSESICLSALRLRGGGAKKSARSIEVFHVSPAQSEKAEGSADRISLAFVGCGGSVKVQRLSRKTVKARISVDLC